MSIESKQASKQKEEAQNHKEANVKGGKDNKSRKNG